MNKVQLIGHVGKDPEARSLQNGGKVVSFSLATSETWKDKKTGDRKERTEWHRIVVFAPGLAGIAEKYIRKGSKVYVEGQLETRKYQDAQKQDRYTTEVVLKSHGAQSNCSTGSRARRRKQPSIRKATTTRRAKFRTDRHATAIEKSRALSRLFALADSSPTAPASLHSRPSPNCRTRRASANWRDRAAYASAAKAA